MSEIRAIVETAIYVDDLGRAEAFYRDVLGLEVIGGEAGRHDFFRVGDGVLLAFDPDAPSDPIGAAARKMHDGSFSQLPVYSGNELVGLLTSETVARWLGDRLADGQGILEEETVEDVMKHGEGSHSFSVMNRHATVDDAVTEFDDCLHSGKILDAVVLAQNGSRNERPLGIVTAADQPKLRSTTRA